MRRAAAARLRGIPAQHLIQQAHPVLMRNVVLNPTPIYAQGSTSTATDRPSRYTMLMTARLRTARWSNKGRRRAAGIDARRDSSAASLIRSAGESENDNV